MPALARVPSTIEDDEVLSRVMEIAHSDNFPDSIGPPSGFVQLLEQFVRFATGDQTFWDNPEFFYKRVRNVWDQTSKRKAGASLIDFRIEQDDPSSGSPKTLENAKLILCLCTDDKPFLVDSVSAAINDAGKSIHFFVNTIIEVSRNAQGSRKIGAKDNRESILYAELDPPIDDAEVENLRASLREVLNEVDHAVMDWQPMRESLQAAIDSIKAINFNRDHSEKFDDLEEAVAFLTWVLNGNFSFFGMRYYNYSTKGSEVSFEQNISAALGILKNKDRRILKNTYSDNGKLSQAVATFLTSDESILVAKSNTISQVHRKVYQDYIGVKNYDKNGKMIGEYRFVGLFTADAYNHSVFDIPLLRKKVQAVLDMAPFSSGGHNKKALINILETYPRDELFQVDVQTIADSSFEILRLYKRPRAKLIMRRDRFDRFISAFVFIPRDLFNSDRRKAIGALLAKTFRGRVSAFYPFFSDASLVRVHYIIGLNPGAPQGPGLGVLNEQIKVLCQDWSTDLSNEMRRTHEWAVPPGLFERYSRAFDAGYRDHIGPEEAVEDIIKLESLKTGEKINSDIIVSAHQRRADDNIDFGVKLIKCGSSLQLSEIIPTLENFGLKVISEKDYSVHVENPKSGEDEEYGIQDFRLKWQFKNKFDLSVFKSKFEQGLSAVLAGKCEDDGFNALIVAAGLEWREAWLLRACSKYHLQAGFSFSQNYLEEVLSKHPQITNLLIEVFHARFKPDARTIKERDDQASGFAKSIISELNQVSSLDEDRIFRRFLDLIMAIIRTNFYQLDNEGHGKPVISLKIDSKMITELPDPKPYREIFVSGPMVDGVHLRFGPIARGGLRWSDRREDFRTEVLGLVKAQRVKNAVIVPTGSKGGFYPKQLPTSKDRVEIYEAGRTAYQFYINALLDVTDNIVDGKIIPPDRVFAFDEEDPYLVVAADKGTAKFSDTANEISLTRNFWLGDAFASGGSVGYDHKVMGITARGAWEAVKRHFREKGKDIQSETFTVAGVGDMSGDVFGNGMLLSKKIRLIAAFDHRDIFIDPEPDEKTSYKERERLFQLPSSSWQDYKGELISKGGGVFSRSVKSITVSKQMGTVLGITEKTVTPNELIKAILKSPVELFWMGGIGTYFKAKGEEDRFVGDRANDAIRITADEMQMQVIGEGANLGLTQAARIAYAQNGGAINTDAIDNSAGVDSSDHEVNIKILLKEAIDRKFLKAQEREALLASMTEDVGYHVLRHNYDQTRGLSLLEARAPMELDGQSRFLIAMEEQGRINREVENLPSSEAIELMKEQGSGLTRPELAVLLAYAKLWLVDEIVKSRLPDDRLMSEELRQYFPEQLHAYGEAIEHHRLRREIIATQMANEIVDTCGITFIHDIILTTGASVEHIVLCYEAARQIYDLNDFAASLKKLDNDIAAQVQNDLYFEASSLLKEQTYRLVTDSQSLKMIDEGGLFSLINHYKEHVSSIKRDYKQFAPPGAAQIVESRYQTWKELGTPEALAREAALFPALERALDIVDIAEETGWSAGNAGSVFFVMGRLLQLDFVREHLRKQPPDDGFDTRATRRLLEELTRQQKALTLNLVKRYKGAPNEKNKDWVNDLIIQWYKEHKDEMQRFTKFMDEIDVSINSLDNNLANSMSGFMGVSKLSLLVRQLAEINERIFDEGYNS